MHLHVRCIWCSNVIVLSWHTTNHILYTDQDISKHHKLCLVCTTIVTITTEPVTDTGMVHSQYVCSNVILLCTATKNRSSEWFSMSSSSHRHCSTHQVHQVGGISRVTLYDAFWGSRQHVALPCDLTHLYTTITGWHRCAYRASVSLTVLDVLFQVVLHLRFGLDSVCCFLRAHG